MIFNNMEYYLNLKAKQEFLDNFKELKKSDIEDGILYNDLTYTEIKKFFICRGIYMKEFPNDMNEFLSSLSKEYLDNLKDTDRLENPKPKLPLIL